MIVINIDKAKQIAISKLTKENDKQEIRDAILFCKTLDELKKCCQLYQLQF